MLKIIVDVLYNVHMTYYTVKNRLAMVPPARKSLVSDIPAGNVKTANHFFTVYVLQ
jgi:hypothetical protein